MTRDVAESAVERGKRVLSIEARAIDAIANRLDALQRQCLGSIDLTSDILAGERLPFGQRQAVGRPAHKQFQIHIRHRSHRPHWSKTAREEQASRLRIFQFRFDRTKHGRYGNSF